VTASRPSENGFEEQVCSLDCFRPSEKVVSLKQGYGRPGEKVPRASVLSGVFLHRQEILCLGESDFAQAKMALEQECSLDYFCLSDKFFARARFLLERNYSRPR